MMETSKKQVILRISPGEFNPRTRASSEKEPQFMDLTSPCSVTETTNLLNGALHQSWVAYVVLFQALLGASRLPIVALFDAGTIVSSDSASELLSN